MGGNMKAHSMYFLRGESTTRSIIAETAQVIWYSLQIYTCQYLQRISGKMLQTDSMSYGIFRTVLVLLMESTSKLSVHQIRVQLIIIISITLALF